VFSEVRIDGVLGSHIQDLAMIALSRPRGALLSGLARLGRRGNRGQRRTAYNRIPRELPTREEHMSEDLRQKIIDIICEEWPTPDGYLLGSYIYERLRRQGVNVTDHVLNDELAGLASRGRITLTLVPHGDTPGQARAGGGATIHDVEDDLCP
jgi:hypothetical protein